MNPTQYLYAARLVPLGKELPVIDLKEGPIVEYFDSCAFALARQKPGDVKLLLDHDDRDGRVAGRFSTIRADGPWLVGTFTVDFDTTPGVIAYDRLRVGTPISIGFTRHNDVPKRGAPGVVHRLVAQLDEASIVDCAAYPGAEVIYKWPIREPKPSPAARAPSPRPSAGEVFYGDGTLVRRNIGQVLGVR